MPFTLQNGVAGSSCADHDNDGDNDMIIACVPSKVYFNNGNGSFSDSTSQIPSFGLYGSWGVAIGDYNENRELDFIFAHAAGYHSPAVAAPCKFYQQQSSVFNPLMVSLPPVTDSLNPYTNPYWSDYDLDGDMDLFMASGPVTGIPDFDFCYKNMKIESGIDSLVAMTSELFAAQTQDGQCYNFIDYDNDGDFDLCLTNYLSAPTRFYKNTGGIYALVSTPFTTTTTNIANCWGDYDNDGDLDVIISNDNQIAKYYRNNAGVSFTYLPGGFSTPSATNGITIGDYVNDGDLDVFTNGIGNNGNTSSVGLDFPVDRGKRLSIGLIWRGGGSQESCGLPPMPLYEYRDLKIIYPASRRRGCGGVKVSLRTCDNHRRPEMKYRGKNGDPFDARAAQSVINRTVGCLKWPHWQRVQPGFVGSLTSTRVKGIPI